MESHTSLGVPNLLNFQQTFSATTLTPRKPQSLRFSFSFPFTTSLEFSTHSYSFHDCSAHGAASFQRLVGELKSIHSLVTRIFPWESFIFNLISLLVSRPSKEAQRNSALPLCPPCSKMSLPQPCRPIPYHPTTSSPHSRT
jgi:hypothetical protein